MIGSLKASKIYTFLIFLFLYAPIIVLVFFSFNSMDSTSKFGGFSLRWYRVLFENQYTMRSLYNSLIVSTIAAVVSTVMGTVAAIGIFKMKKWLKTSVMNITNIPMLNPDIVTGISMLLLFVFIGRLLGLSEMLGFWTVLIAHVTFNLPYVILSVLPKLRQLDKSLEEAAQDLGCTPVQSFFKAVLPQLTPGILTGMIMAFTLSIDDFVISYFTAGPRFETLPIHIFAMTKKRVTPDINALSTILFTIVLVLLIIINVRQARDEKLSARA